MGGNMMKLWSADELEKRLGIGRTSIWRLEREGDFPARIQLTPGRVAWREDELLDWIESRERPGWESESDPEEEATGSLRRDTMQELPAEAATVAREADAQAQPLHEEAPDPRGQARP